MWLASDPDIVTTSTNRNLLEPTKVKKARRASSIQKGMTKGKHSKSNSGAETSNTRSFRAPVVNELIREESSSSKSAKSGRSQLVDLVVEDTEAEQVERVRARKEGGAAWNGDEAKHFVRTYDDEDEGEIIRSGFQPGKEGAPGSSDFAVGGDEDEQGDATGSGEAQQQDERHDQDQTNTQYGNLDDREVWNVKEDDEP